MALVLTVHESDAVTFTVNGTVTRVRFLDIRKASPVSQGRLRVVIDAPREVAVLREGAKTTTPKS
jgi:sRNA-binding carbon storage regulator CsrA